MGGEGDTAPRALDEVALARAALGATRGVAGVAGISPGRYALARTFGRGGTVVEGIQLTPMDDGLRVEVHVVVRPVPILALADAIRMAVAGALADADVPVAVAAVDVWVDDLRVTDADDAAGEEGAG